MRLAARLVLTAALAWGVRAQDVSPLKLTLKDAVNLALKQNPQVILANLGTSFSQQEQQLARSALLPQAAASVSEVARRVNLQAQLGISFPGLPKHVGPFENFQAGASFGGPILDLALWRRYRASQVGVDVSRAAVLAAREESVILVVSQYLGSQRAAADVEAAQSRADLAQALFNQAADLQKNGVGTGIDTLRANVQLQNALQRLIQARTQLDTSLFGLARLLAIDPHRPIELADQVGFFETPAVATGADQTIERAWIARPEIRQLQAQRRQAELNLRAAGDQRLPRLSATGFWAQQGLTPSSIIPVYQYQGELAIPLFTGGRIQAQRAEAELAIRQLETRATDVRNRIALEVKTAAAQLEAARNEVVVANLGADLARQEVEQARDRFQAGVANNIEVVTAQDELARANDNRIAALYRYNQARADLAHAAGQVEALYAR